MNRPTEDIPVYSIESLKSTRQEEVREFDFFRFEYFVHDIDHLRVPHRHHFYTFLLVTMGDGSHDIDFTTYALKPNRLFLIAPGQVHAWNQLSHVKGFVVLFTDSFVALSKGRKIMAAWPLFRMDQPCYLDLKPAEVALWVEEFKYMEQETNRTDDFSRDAIFYSIGTLLVRASRLYHHLLYKNKTGTTDLLVTFQELIEKHFMEWRAPREYAARMNLTANYLNSICKKKSGKSAGELIRQRVLLEAKRLLAHTTLTVAEIAYKLNFEDNSYFGRYFKKYTGLTPETFRLQKQ
ncbi:MAG: helix-turn-helix domain-containing protein [Cyclobacteriaceae bacterium]|nr:helix-turn-helix domain-containing protein [Cyclobacteriaceae bacterium]